VLLSYGIAAVFVSFGLVIVIIPTTLAIGVYLVLFGWIIVAAFKMGMIFQHSPQVTTNKSLNLSVITPMESERPPAKAENSTDATQADAAAGTSTAPLVHKTVESESGSSTRLQAHVTEKEPAKPVRPPKESPLPRR